MPADCLCPPPDTTIQSADAYFTTDYYDNFPPPPPRPSAWPSKVLQRVFPWLRIDFVIIILLCFRPNTAEVSSHYLQTGRPIFCFYSSIVKHISRKGHRFPISKRRLIIEGGGIARIFIVVYFLLRFLFKICIRRSQFKHGSIELGLRGEQGSGRFPPRWFSPDVKHVEQICM